MKLRAILAIVLVPVVVSLALVAVSHIHGVTDPTKPHTLGEQFALGQARSGFATASLLTLLVVVALVGWVTLDPFGLLPQPLFWAYISRGPPLFPS